MEQRCLLIVEDEYWTRYKLVHQHYWEGMGISRVLEAENGESAIELMDREHVDFVITDMDMPYIDGGELAKWIQKNHPEISVIVLSGYSDFPTVHSALEGGVIDYLLKPASDFDLKKAIDKLTQEMEMRTSTQKEIERGSRLVRALALSNFLRSGSFQELADELFPDGTENSSQNSYRLVVVRVRLPRDNNRTNFTDLMEYSEQVICEFLNITPIQMFCNTTYHYEFIALASDTPDLRSSLEQLVTTLYRTQIFQYVFCGISLPFTSRNQILIHYKKCVNSLYSYPINDDKYHVTVEKNDPDVAVLEDSQFYDSLLRAAKLDDNETVVSLLEKHFFMPSVIHNHWSYQDYAIAVSSAINAYIIGNSARDKSFTATDIENINDELQEDIRLFDYRAANHMMVQILQVISGSAEPEADNRQTISKMSEIKEYVDQNFTSELSLLSLAETFHLSTSYLSRCFRKYTGVNLINYITDLRLAYARELLTQSNYSITDIAFVAGYEDYSYFSNQFHSKYGKSPREYRSDCLKS